MSELNFIEYNVNTEEYSPADVVIALRGLGFQQISDAKNYKATMWACNGCIILLSLHNNIPTGLSGFGLNMPTAPDGSRHCETTGLNIWKDPNGLNVYSYPVENFRQAFDDHFTMAGTACTEDALQYFAGFVYKCKNVDTRNTYINQLKLKSVKTTDNYVTTVCSQNRFNILWDLNSDNNVIDQLTIVTDDIADVTAKMVGRGFDSKEITTGRQQEILEKYLEQEQALFPPTHFVQAWDLNLGGKEKSFVLEKMFENALPNLNIVVQQRNNHNGFNEETLLYYSEQDMPELML
jgi:hypothetical protein